MSGSGYRLREPATIATVVESISDCARFPGVGTRAALLDRLDDVLQWRNDDRRRLVAQLTQNQRRIAADVIIAATGTMPRLQALRAQLVVAGAGADDDEPSPRAA